jgi:tetratricopeptide (TPR) repeat protein
VGRRAGSSKRARSHGRDHEVLIQRGSDLHEARQYGAALRWFERALLVAPDCPVAVYNRANTLHMLDRDHEAEGLLRELIAATPQELRRRCPETQPRSLQLDAHFLLFLVLADGRGPCEGAFAFAAKHLRLRRRGLYSVWSAREVRNDIAAMRRKWEKCRQG